MTGARLQVIDPQASFSCGGCTKCCTQPYAVLIEHDKAAALERHDFSEYPQLRDRTFTSSSKDAPAGYQVLAKQEGSTRCLFLADDGLCIIHKELGPEAKPHPCLRYPFLVSPTFVDDRVSLDFGCPHVQANQGQLLTAQADDIAGICKVSSIPVYDAAEVELTSSTKLPHAAYDDLMGRMEAVMGHEGTTSICERFAALLTLAETAAGVQPSSESDAATTPQVLPYDKPAAAASPVRMLFAATLMRDVLPPTVTLNMSLWRRVKLLPKLMSLAKLTGSYESKFLGRTVNVDDVLAYPVSPDMDRDATSLLARYFRTRLWQRFLVGTRLSVVAGLHQHIHDLNAILFLARAEALYHRVPRLTRAFIARGLSHVELNIANQPRVFNQKTLGWFSAQLDSVALAHESLRLMLPAGESANRSVVATAADTCAAQ